MNVSRHDDDEVMPSNGEELGLSSTVSLSKNRRKKCPSLVKDEVVHEIEVKKFRVLKEEKLEKRGGRQVTDEMFLSRDFGLSSVDFQL